MAKVQYWCPCVYKQIRPVSD